VNEHGDGGFEVVLAFVQFIPVSRAAEGADRSVCGICQHLHLAVARDELYRNRSASALAPRRSHSMRAAR
jgi:hypothetical protein